MSDPVGEHEQEIVRAKEIIRGKMGIEIPAGRDADLAEGLNAMADSLALPVSMAIEQIQIRPVTDPALSELIRRLTINETHFFRNEPQFKVLRSQILPELFKDRKESKSLRIWSAACSSGEEPYSAAMLLRHMLPDIDQWNPYIIGTDIDREILDKARLGTYGEWSFRQVPEEFDQFFTTSDGLKELVPEVRRMVQFELQNLVDVDSWLPRKAMFGKMDIIFCRNVLIYFNGETTQKIIDALYECLQPGGWLIVGHAEPSQERFHRFITHTLPQTIIYQRPAENEQPHIKLPQRRSAVGQLSLQQIREVVKKDPERAINTLQNMIDEPDPAGERRLLLAKLLAGRKRLNEAAEHAAAAVQQAGLSAEAYYVHGTILREMGDPEAALDVLRRAVFLNKDFILARVQLAECQASLGQNDRARKELQQAAEMLEGKPASSALFGDRDMTAGRLRELIGSRLRLLPD